jgi:hypothetical protein
MYNLLGCTYSVGSSTAKRPLILFSGIPKSCCIAIKFDHFHIFKLFTFQGIFKLGEEGKVTWRHVWVILALIHIKE